MPTLTGLVPVAAKCIAVLLVSAALAVFTPAQRWRMGRGVQRWHSRASCAVASCHVTVANGSATAPHVVPEVLRHVPVLRKVLEERLQHGVGGFMLLVFLQLAGK